MKGKESLSAGNNTGNGMANDVVNDKAEDNLIERFNDF